MGTMLLGLAGEIVPPTVPASGADIMPADSGSFWEDLVEIFIRALQRVRPDIAEAGQICLGVIALVLLFAILEGLPSGNTLPTVLVGTVGAATLLLGSTGALVKLAVTTVGELSDYGKLLIPVMTTAMAAQGGITASAALYAGSTLFNSLLSSLISGVLVPMVYIFLALSIAGRSIRDKTLSQLRGFVKWLITWLLKTLLYIFTGYMSITGVVSGTTDAVKMKAAKLTISGMVPVVGGILSDASEAVLVSTAVVRNGAGIYGILAVISICLLPFLRIGAHYLLVKWTGAVCAVFGSGETTELINDFAGAMGLLAAMTGAVCVMLLISIVCFLREVG